MGHHPDPGLWSAAAVSGGSVPPVGPRQLENLRGLLLMGLGIAFYGLVDMQAKLLTGSFHPVQIVWVRQLGLLLVAFYMLRRFGPVLFRTAQPGLQILRGALAAGSATIFIVAIAYVPLADATAVSFVAPFIVTVLGAVLLREPVGLRRWVAVSVGFVGTLIVIRPGLGVVHPAAFLVLLAAALFALRQILSRALSATDRTWTTVVYTAFVGSAILTLFVPFVWQWPATGREVALLFGMAVLAAAGEICVIKALEIALAVVVAPMQYTLMVWATLYGFLVFGHLPDLWTWVGTGVIIATGLYTLHRERVAGRRTQGEET